MLKICVFNVSKYYTSFQGVKIKFISHSRTMQHKIFKIEMIYSTCDKTALTVTHVIKVRLSLAPSNNQFLTSFILPPNSSLVLQPVFMTLDFLPKSLPLFFFFFFGCTGSTFGCVSFLCLQCGPL